jgi:hypothetical protein
MFDKDIPDGDVNLIATDGGSHGIIPRDRAIELAHKRGLKLVQVNVQRNHYGQEIPIVKIADPLAVCHTTHTHTHTHRPLTDRKRVTDYNTCNE